jgi:hypothetical protein
VTAPFPPDRLNEIYAGLEREAREVGLVVGDLLLHLRDLGPHEGAEDQARDRHHL